MRSADIAQRLAERIAAGGWRDGEQLPSETALAREFGVARGTVRRALEELAGGPRAVARRGHHWIARRAQREQSLDMLRSFGQWALASGLCPSGLTVQLRQGRATATEAYELGLRRGQRVTRIVRVMALDGRPAMIKRTTYPEWLSAIIAEVPADARSIMEVVEARHGLSLGRAEHHISAVPAGVEDARLLGIPRARPLLRVVRTAHAADGRPFEHSDDRYDAGTVGFSIINAGPAARGPELARR